MARYRIGHRYDAYRFSAPCTLDPSRPKKATKDLLKKEAEKVCEDGSYKFGESYIKLTPFGIEVKGRDEDAEWILSVLKSRWDVRPY